VVLVKKSSGLLCHLSSLPTVYGIGDLGPVAYQWVDHLKKSGQTYWQILPIGNTDDSGSPYSTDSAFGMAEFYISPDFLIKDLNLDANIFDQFKNQEHLSSSRVNYKDVKKNKNAILEIAFQKFSSDLDHNEFLHKKMDQFLQQEESWLADYCSYRVFVETRGSDWIHWPQCSLAQDNFTEYEKQRFQYFQFVQFIALNQLSNLRKYANSHNVQMIGDLPIFVSYSSMDVWSHPDEFLLDEKTLRMELETGAAPDAFSDTGQKWGTPIYNWDRQEQKKFSWWIARTAFLSRYFDVVRIDHFRGFCATWVSGIQEPDAKKGFWSPGPAEKLFLQLKPTAEIIVEDLGVITADVETLRDQFHFPGLRVLQFMLGDESNPHKIKNYIYNSVAYTGTHDCDTLVGWYNQLSSEYQKYVQQELNESQITHWTLLQKLMNSESKLVISQIQDVLGLGSEARFNYPGTVTPLNWTWQLTEKQFLDLDWEKLRALTAESHRLI
jgi:4-alpha-glucanotransferase